MTADGDKPAGDAGLAGLAPADALPVTRGQTSQAALHDVLQENAELKRQLAQVAGELEDFTYSVSHDLRASLRHISAFVAIINEDRSAGIEADISSHLATITHAAQHMTLMIDALMELSRLGQVELNLSTVDVRLLIDEACEALQRPAQAAATPESATATSAQASANSALAHPIQWRIANDFPPLQADPVLLRQALQHLIANSMKFTRPASGRPAAQIDAQIEIGWRTLPDDGRSRAAHPVAMCELFVRDNGVGFNPKFGDKLFGVFQRLHTATEFDGIGMGLALTRRIVQRHGGSVTALSPVRSEGQSALQTKAQPQVVAGCEVTFTLPLAIS